jgi:hypothetical protein
MSLLNRLKTEIQQQTEKSYNQGRITASYRNDLRIIHPQIKILCSILDEELQHGKT